jgi:hypothetical protein
MVNWIQGHNEQTKFKAFVTHDGVFDPKNTWYQTEELFVLSCSLYLLVH